jgi:2-alkyl-3-oxoalkanoate reductase
VTLEVLVHGSDTFVGRHLLASLGKSAWASAVPVISGDAAALRAALSQVGAVIHCSVGSASAVARAAEALYTCLDAGAAARGMQPRVVHIGSMTVYDPTLHSANELSSTGANRDAYAVAQLLAEQRAAKYAAVVLRSGVEVGADCPHWSGRIARLLAARRLGDLGSAGDGICNLTYIEDLTTIALMAARQPGIEGEIFNVAVASKPTWNEYLIEFALALGAVPVRRLTRRRLAAEKKLFAPPLKVIEIAVGKLGLPAWLALPPIPASLLATCAQNLALDVSKAERLFGTPWTPTADILRAAAAYYRR